MFNKKIFSERLKESRKIKGFSQEQLANKLDATKTFVSDLERERRTTTLEKLYELSVVLDVSSDYLLGLSDKTFGDR